MKHIQGNDLDGTFEYEHLLGEVGEEWNDQFRPNASAAAHLVLALLDALTLDQQWSPEKQQAAVMAVQDACAAKIHRDTEQNLTRLGESNQLAFDTVKPHLEIAGPSVEKNTPTFTAALSAYLEAPDDPTSLRLSNLRLMAETLQRNLTLISGLLTQIVNSHAPWEKIRTFYGPCGLRWMLPNRSHPAQEIHIPLALPHKPVHGVSIRGRVI